MKTRFTGYEPIRHDRLVQEYRHDAYKSKLKLPEPTVCPECGAVYHEGRWQWAAKPAHNFVRPATASTMNSRPVMCTLAGLFSRSTARNCCT